MKEFEANRCMIPINHLHGPSIKRTCIHPDLQPARDAPHQILTDQHIERVQPSAQSSHGIPDDRRGGHAPIMLQMTQGSDNMTALPAEGAAAVTSYPCTAVFAQPPSRRKLPPSFRQREALLASSNPTRPGSSSDVHDDSQDRVATVDPLAGKGIKPREKDAFMGRDTTTSSSVHSPLVFKGNIR